MPKIVGARGSRNGHVFSLVGHELCALPHNTKPLIHDTHPSASLFKGCRNNDFWSLPGSSGLPRGGSKSISSRLFQYRNEVSSYSTSLSNMPGSVVLRLLSLVSRVSRIKTLAWRIPYSRVRDWQACMLRTFCRQVFTPKSRLQRAGMRAREGGKIIHVSRLTASQNCHL